LEIKRRFTQGLRAKVLKNSIKEALKNLSCFKIFFVRDHHFLFLTDNSVSSWGGVRGSENICTHQFSSSEQSLLSDFVCERPLSLVFEIAPRRYQQGPKT